MTVNRKYKLQKILITLVWILVGAGTIVLLVAAISKKNNEHCLETNIIITGVQNNFFIDKGDVIKILKKINGGKLETTPIAKIDLASMENALQKDQWIKKAELFFDNNNVLQVRVSEREPVARVFTISGKSFYLDSSLKRLPLSDKFSARLPVFTSFPTDLIVLTKKDSSLLEQIKTLGEFVGNDPFWMAQIEQADINPDGSFELIPKIGNQVIHFGNADNYVQKFRKLLAFYKRIEAKSGWATYSAIDLKYSNQVIGIRRGANEIKMDSLRTIQIMKNIIANAQKRTNDSTNIQLVQPADDNSIINNHREIDDPPAEQVSTLKKPVDIINVPVGIDIEKQEVKQDTEAEKTIRTIKPPGKKPKPADKPLQKPVVETQAKQKSVPKAVMPAKSDYE